MLGLFLLLVVLVGVLVGLVWYGVSTENGTRTLLARLGGFIPGTLTIGSQRGPLLGPLELKDVHYSTPEGMDVRVDRFELRWDAGKLRRKQLDVQRLHADGIRVVLPPAKEEKEPEDGRLVDIHLPVNIIVRDALIRNVEIVTPPKPGAPEQPPFKLARIALDAQSELGSDVVHVRGLDVDGPTFKLRAQGDLTPVGDYPVDLRAQATYDDAQYPPFVVSGAFKGTLEKLGLDARLAAPFAAHVTGDVIAPMRELEMDLAARFQGFEAQKINPAWPVARVSQGDVKIKGKLDDFVSEGKVAGAYEGYGSGEATYRLARRGEDFIFEYLNLKTENGARLSARGTVGTEEKDLDLDLVAEWQGLAWPLQGGPPVVVSRSGEAKVTGSLAEYKVDVDAQLAGPNIPPGRWILAGEGTQEKMDIRSLKGDVLKGRLAAAGRVTWKPQVTWNVKLDGKGLNPGALAPEWPGSLAFAATTNGTLKDAGPYGQVDLLNVDGNLRGNPVAGRVRLELAGEHYRLPRLDLRSGSARVTAAGSFTKDVGNLDWKLEAPNLGEALPDAGGAVTAQGHLAGPWKSPRVQAQANGQSIVFRTYNVNTLALVADVDLASNGRIQLDLDATNVGLGERRFDTVNLDGRGTRRAHEVTLAVKAPEGTLGLALAGGLVGTTNWDGQIRRLDLANEQTGTWSLAGPAALAAGTERASLKDFCFTSAANNNARLCAQGDWTKTGPWNASGTIADLPFTLFKPFLPPDLEITGAVNGAFQGQGTPGGFITANVDLRPGPGEIRYPAGNGETARIRYDQGLVNLTAGRDGLASRANLSFVDTGGIEAELRLPQYNAVGADLKSQSVAGRIQANFSNLALLEAFVSDVKNPRGTLNADLAIQGTVAAPKAVGSVALRGAQVDVPEFGLEVRQIELTATSDPQGVLQLQGSARSGGGNVTIAGNVPLDKRPARVTVQGKRFLAADYKGVKVLVSPNLVIAAEYPRIEVSGDVEIPEAKIGEQKKRRPGAIPVSKDVYIVPPSEEQLANADKPPLELRARIRVILGDKVEIVEYSGFSGKPSGSLLVIEQPGKPTTAVGELVVKEGIYKSYGQDLTLERGRVIFAGGPLDNPGLDLRAYRKADDGVVAGLNIRGTLKAPETTIYSDPAMAQDQALAYILLGHPLGQSTPQEGSLLANAANSLGLKGGNLLAKKLGARYGLEEAKIESTGGLKEASLVVGKYLSPRLYVNYGIGLFEPVSTFRIRYLLGREWSIQAEQGTETSADFLYTVERGKGGETPPPVKDKGEDVKGPSGTTSDNGGGRR